MFQIISHFISPVYLSASASQQKHVYVLVLKFMATFLCETYFHYYYRWKLHLLHTFHATTMLSIRIKNVNYQGWWSQMQCSLTLKSLFIFGRSLYFKVENISLQNISLTSSKLRNKSSSNLLFLIHL